MIAGAQVHLQGDDGTSSGISVVQCGVGQTLNDNRTVFNQQSNDWVIDCNSLTSVNYPLVNFTNPSCKQLAAKAPVSTALASCPGLPLTPVMTYTTGSISCSPCPTGLYNLSRGALIAGKLRTITCVTRLP